jgi:quercetin dioxygenase-like cupin family protein
MNRRKFVELAAVAPLVSAVDLQGTPAGKPLIALPNSARVYDVGHGKAAILIGGEQSGGAWWCGVQTSDAGRKTSLHVHFKADERFYVLEGRVSLWLDGEWQDLPPGAVAEVPRGVPHALGNRSQQSVRFLVAGNPAGFEKFFADIAATARNFPYGSPAFLAELKKVYTKYDSELLAPPPLG